MKRPKRRVRVSVLPGEPTDGTGRVCIHLFVQDPSGLITEPHVLHPVVGSDGKLMKNKLEAKPTRGRLACDPNRRISNTEVRGVVSVTIRTDDPRAVTCPRCIAAVDYRRIMKLMEAT